MTLRLYHKKRKFDQTPEPKGSVKKAKGNLSFVVQKHDASHLHYDFRLEWEGVLKSFAIPKGPSMNPADKHLAIQTEDHPLDYASFEGRIPKGNYGAGEVIVWDNGTYMAEGAKTKKENLELLQKGFKKGHLSIELFGQKLKGGFSLVRTSKDEPKSQWLFIKKEDEFSTKKDILEKKNSVLSSKKLTIDSKENIDSFSKQNFPTDFTPMLATLTDKPFSKEGWLFEYKYDGYRTIAEIKKGEVHLFSRHRISFDEKFKSVREALKSIKHTAILDGEVVALTENKESFEALQNVGQQKTSLRYFVFDLLFLDGYDLRRAPLLERKKLIRELIVDSKTIVYSPHRLNEGVKYFDEIEAEGGEGIMAKKMDSPYQSGIRSKQWLKIKADKRQEVVIGGFTEPKKSRKLFGALIAGVYNDQGDLEYVGHVGGGFNDESLKKVYHLLKKNIRKTCPFKKTPKTNAPATWVKPIFVAEVKFREWTKENQMRQPIFLGLRVDKYPEEVKKEIPKKAEEVIAGKIQNKKSKSKFTNLEKVLWPALGTAKGDLIAYYESISKILLPYLKDRPESLLRHPHGVTGSSFYQKNVNTLRLPGFVDTISIFSESNESEIKYLICNNKETLLYMAQLGALEIHPWNSRISNLENPDYMIFDVDPSDDDFSEVVKVTLAIKEVLDSSCEKSYVKTSGKRGMHILVPLGAQYNYDIIREFAHLLMQIVHKKLPEITSLERRPKERKGKIYLDYLQNRQGQTLAAPYSLRATPEATVSTPLEWNEVNEDLDPKAFTILNIQERIKKKGDLWKNLLKEKVDLEKAIQRLKKYYLN